MSSNLDQELVCGLNTVNQIIISRPKSVQSLYVGEALNTRIESVVDEAKKNKINRKDMYAVNTVSAIVFLQIIFGILALINGVPIWLGSIHQIGAFFLLASSVYCVFIFKKTV